MSLLLFHNDIIKGKKKHYNDISIKLNKVKTKSRVYILYYHKFAQVRKNIYIYILPKKVINVAKSS